MSAATAPLCGRWVRMLTPAMHEGGYCCVCRMRAGRFCKWLTVCTCILSGFSGRLQAGGASLSAHRQGEMMDLRSCGTHPLTPEPVSAQCFWLATKLLCGYAYVPPSARSSFFPLPIDLHIALPAARVMRAWGHLCARCMPQDVANEAVDFLVPLARRRNSHVGLTGAFCNVSACACPSMNLPQHEPAPSPTAPAVNLPQHESSPVFPCATMSRKKHVSCGRLCAGGWYSNYIQELPEDDQAVLYNLKYRGEEIGRQHAMPARERASVFVTQYPLDTYAVDLHR